MNEMVGLTKKVIELADPKVVGAELYDFATELYPICRSITGEGIRQTLNLIGERIPLHKFNVPTGTRVFDWTVPKEWNIRDAYIKDSDGRRVVDFQKSNLHVLNYSAPIRAKMPLCDLKLHLFSIPSARIGSPIERHTTKKTGGSVSPMTSARAE